MNVAADPNCTVLKTDLADLAEGSRGIQMIPAYSPQARGRSERNFGAWQGRLPQELRLHRIVSVEEANQFLREHYIAEFNRSFEVRAAERGTAFLQRRSQNLDLVFSLQFERAVNRDNTVSFSASPLADRSGALASDPGGLHGAGASTLGRESYDHPRTAALGRYSAEGKLLAGKMAVGPVVEKMRTGKVQAPTFPPRLEIPQTTRDSHFPTTSATAG